MAGLNSLEDVIQRLPPSEGDPEGGRGPSYSCPEIELILFPRKDRESCG